MPYGMAPGHLLGQELVDWYSRATGYQLGLMRDCGVGMRQQLSTHLATHQGREGEDVLTIRLARTSDKAFCEAVGSALMRSAAIAFASTKDLIQEMTEQMSLDSDRCVPRRNFQDVETSPRSAAAKKNAAEADLTMV
eukprot:6473208-Amphidinium_carterae.1